MTSWWSMQTGKKIGAWPDPKDQRPHSSQGDHNICLHDQIGHQGMWSFGSTGGCSSIQQLLASEACSCAWTVSHSDWWHCLGGVCNGITFAVAQQRHRPGQGLPNSGSAGWETPGQICRSDGCGTHPRLDSYEPIIKDNGIPYFSVDGDTTIISP